MTDDLITLITRVQPQLLDDGTLFSSTTCTAAIRAALKDLNTHTPYFGTLQITPSSNTIVYEIASSDLDYNLTPRDVASVFLALQTDTNQRVATLYDVFWKDEKLYVRLWRTPDPAYDLIVNFTAEHIINGLDSATASTLSTFADQVLVDGACYYALIYRAASRAEANNLNANVPDEYQKIAVHFETAFNAGLAVLARRKPDDIVSTAAWNDEWHNWST